MNTLITSSRVTLAKAEEPTTAECTGVSTEMSIAVTSHKPGDVLEQGVECVFIAECGVGKDRACDEVQILLGVNGWTGKSWRTVHDCARVDPSPDTYIKSCLLAVFTSTPT